MHQNGEDMYGSVSTCNIVLVPFWLDVKSKDSSTAIHRFG